MVPAVSFSLFVRRRGGGFFQRAHMDREWVLVRLSLTAADVAWFDALVVDGGYRSRAECRDRAR
jgi:hypothetical protein